MDHTTAPATSRRALLRTSLCALPLVISAAACTTADGEPSLDTPRTAPRTAPDSTPPVARTTQNADRVVGTVVLPSTGGTISGGSHVSFIFPRSYFRTANGRATTPQFEFVSPDWAGSTNFSRSDNGERIITAVAAMDTQDTSLAFMLTYKRRYGFTDTADPVSVRINVTGQDESDQTLHPELLPGDGPQAA